MSNLLRKELKLVTSPMTWIFLVFSLMTFVPGYPILMSAFFICLGIFQSFHQTRLTNDILFTTLLPVEKGDAVKSKYIVVCFIELVGFVLILIFSLIRLNVSKTSEVYAESPLMCPNLVFLGATLLIFLFFNLIFVGGFFKTADKVNKPYLLFLVAALIVILLAEMLHFIPGFSFLNALPGECPVGGRLLIFIICAIVFAGGTWLSYKAARKHFEALDL